MTPPNVPSTMPPLNVAEARLREHGPLSPSLFAHSLMAEYGCTEAQARDVIWHLIDQGRIHPDMNLQLEVR